MTQGFPGAGFAPGGAGGGSESGAALRNTITTVPFADVPLGGSAVILPGLTAALANISNQKRYGIRVQFNYTVVNAGILPFSDIIQSAIRAQYDALPLTLFWLWSQQKVDVLPGSTFNGMFCYVTTKEPPAVAAAALMTVDVSAYFPNPLPAGVTAAVYSLSAGTATVELTEYKL